MDRTVHPRPWERNSRKHESMSALRKLAGQNMLRVLRQNETTARKLQRERPASTATIEKLDGPRR